MLYLGITVLACIGYGAVFLTLGLFFRNPMLPAAAVSRAARAGLLHTRGTPIAFMGRRNTNRLLVGLALAEIVADKLSPAGRSWG